MTELFNHDKHCLCIFCRQPERKEALAGPEPDNNNCPKHDYFNLTCGTCNGLFDAEGNDLRLEDSSQGEGTVTSPSATIEDKLRQILWELYNVRFPKQISSAVPDALKAIQAIITTETTRLVASEKHQCGNKPNGKQVVTFSAKQMIAWADKQEAWGTSPAWAKNQDDADGYARAMRHLRYYVQNPVSDLLGTDDTPASGESDALNKAYEKG